MDKKTTTKTTPKKTTTRRLGRPPKTIPAAPVEVPENPKPALERIHDAFLNLLAWSEGLVWRINAGELEVGNSLLDSVVKTLSTCAKELPRLETEIKKAAEVAWSEKDEEAFRQIKGEEAAEPAVYWTDEDEARFQAAKNEEPYAVPDPQPGLRIP